MTFDAGLSFKSHVKQVASKANSRIGMLRRAGNFLDPVGRGIVYKGFVRPVMEYAPLAWAGAAPSTLELLDKVQRRAEKIIAGDSNLHSLKHRRKVSALSYLYKLQTDGIPERLKKMVPSSLPPPAAGPTRTAKEKCRNWHHNLIQNSSNPKSLDLFKRSFPDGFVNDWNSLPTDFFGGAYDVTWLQPFKKKLV